jgi:hypothetical protein
MALVIFCEDLIETYPKAELDGRAWNDLFSKLSTQALYFELLTLSLLRKVEKEE